MWIPTTPTAARSTSSRSELQMRSSIPCATPRRYSSMVKGLMIESYIEDGAQKVGDGVYGKSITDPCLGWEKSEKLVLE